MPQFIRQACLVTAVPLPTGDWWVTHADGRKEMVSADNFATDYFSADTAVQVMRGYHGSVWNPSTQQLEPQ